MGKHEKKKKRHSSESSRERHRHKSSHRRRQSNDGDDSPHHRDGSKSDRHRRDSDERDRPLTAAEMEIVKAEKKKEKQLLKALETPEEKRARRLLKKVGKERKRKANMGWDEEYMGYTNIDNPFGDEHLLDTFVWSKKLEKLGIKNASMEDIEKLQKQKMIENKLELEKVKKRRLEREREREERDTEHEMLQRTKEAEYYREWEEQEDNFHLQQAKLRSTIRIQDDRAKPIDLLGKYISAEDDDFSVEMHEPYIYLTGLTVTDLEDLLEDIKVYMELEQGKNVDYWRDITTIVQEEIDTLKKMDTSSRDYVGDRRSGINTSVSDDVNVIFKGKSMEQLAMLETQISKKLSGGEGVDVGYWESLLQKLKAHMARSRLREKHQEQLRRKLFKLKQDQGIASEPLFPISQAQGENEASGAENQGQGDPGDSPGAGPSGAKSHSESESEHSEHGESGNEEDKNDQNTVITEEDLHTQSYTDYETGGYSPKLLKFSDLNPDAIIYDPEDDMKRLEFARVQLQQTGKVKKDSDADLVKRARAGMTNDEAQFSVEVPLADQNLLWSDKYRPRKPRFFNRVHTGFEWNKYNQTHYDIDNPPPKIVQGYKFNIFYPDLIDKAKTPEYHLTPLEDNPEFGMLRFKAGPPYEDIAFKIVNREWEYSYKRGFRCQFHNNIFQLWFHFKRYRYRR